MNSTWLKRPQSGGILVSSLIGLSFFLEPAAAWQFRDLGPTEDNAHEVSPSDAVDLIPTNEEFLAPIINASELNKKSEKVGAQKVDAQKVGAQKVGEEKVGGLKRPAVQPTVASNTKPQPAKVTASVKEPNLEPVPMPELHGEDQGKPMVEEPMWSFSIRPEHPDGQNPPRDVRVAKFNNVQPGMTKLSELTGLWGQPVKTIDQEDASQRLLYRIPSFQQVDVTIQDDIVSSVLVHLLEPVTVPAAVSNLNLAEFAPVPVPDEFGEVLGQAYPELGLLFNFTDDIDTLHVSAILLEPLSGETFRLRAQHDFDHQYKRSLADLNQALLIDPTDSGTYWLKAEILDATGRTDEAMKTVKEAIRLEPTNPLYRILRARLLAKTNKRETAIEETRAVLDAIDMPSEIAARAHCLLGHLLALGPDAAHEEALEHHLKAIEFGINVTNDRRFAIRRMAKHVLVDAHLSVARDIAMGNYQRQQEVVPKWLLRATELADEFMSDDNGDEFLRLHVYCNTLACCSELQGNFESVVASEEALRIGHQLIAGANDQLYKMQIERLLAETLMHSAKIERSRGRYDVAMQYAQNGLALLENTNGQWQETSHDDYLRGQLYFLLGSLQAVHKENHYEAVKWYTKADGIFVDSNFISPLYNDREHGEMHVSMGLSFWETGDHEKALRMTQLGADLMKDAVEDGALQVTALSVPYGNLATMHDNMGHHGKSQEFAELVIKVAEITLEEKRR